MERLEQLLARVKAEHPDVTWGYDASGFGSWYLCKGDEEVFRAESQGLFLLGIEAWLATLEPDSELEPAPEP